MARLTLIWRLGCLSWREGCLPSPAPTSPKRPLFRKVLRPGPSSQAGPRRNPRYDSAIVFGKVPSHETRQCDPALPGILNGRGSGPAPADGPAPRPLRPAQCHPDLAHVSPWVTRGRSHPLTMGHARPEGRALACPARQKRSGSPASLTGLGTPRPPSPPTRVCRDGLRVCVRTGKSAHGADRSPYRGRGRARGWLRLPGASPYVTARVWILFGQQRGRYPRPATVSRPSEHSAYGPLYGIDRPTISELLGGLRPLLGGPGGVVNTHQEGTRILSWRRMTASLY